MPAALAFPLQGRRYNWAYETDPEPHMNNRRMECGAAKGCSSLINGMCYIRGNAMDFDNWAKAPGLEDWTYTDCLPYFRKAETRDIGPNDYHGGEGPVSVTTPKAGNNELFHAMVEAGVQVTAHRRSERLPAREAGPMDRTVTPKGRRASTARGYLDQARSRPNLKIVTHALTDHIVFDGKRAVGVNYLQGDSNQLTHAKRGASVAVRRCHRLATDPAAFRARPEPAALLKSLDIQRGARSAGRRENLQSLEMYLQYACKPVSLYPALQSSTSRRSARMAVQRRTGIGASNQFEAGGFIRSRAEFPRPNIRYHFLPVAINYNSSNAVKEHGFRAHVGSMRSPSRSPGGEIERSAPAPESILFNYMATEQDWQEFRDAIRITRGSWRSRRWTSTAAAR